MTDHETIHALINEDKEYEMSKFTKYDWRTLNDSNYGVYTGPIKFQTTSLMSELIDIKNAYIIINGNISSSAANYNADSKITIKNGSYSLLYETVIKANNTVIDHPMNLWLVMQIHNLLEFSQDYAISVAELWMYAKDTSIAASNNMYNSVYAAGPPISVTTTADPDFNSGYTKRLLYRGPIAANRFPISINIPIMFLSPFFKHLEFPTVNIEWSIELRTRPNNTFLHRENGIANGLFNIQSTQMYIPVVKMNTQNQIKFNNKLDKGFKKSVVWNKTTVYEQNQLKPLAVGGHVNDQIDPSFQGATRLFIIAIINDNYNEQENTDEVFQGVITDVNVNIDGAQFYQNNLLSDYELYNLLREQFNFGGQDLNTGSQISFLEWKKLYRIYAFDLRRQQALEEDPRKPQNIRVSYKLMDHANPANAANVGTYKIFYILEQEKETVFDFSKAIVKIY